jgi:restriction system protein
MLASGVAIPDFQTLMRPLLELHADGREWTQAELRAALAEQFQLTDDELDERLPSGTAKTFLNRVAWASTHLSQAGLIEKPRRGVSRITERGRAVLDANLDRIDLSILDQFSEYRDFRARSSQRRGEPVADGATDDHGTAEEVIDGAYQEIRQLLADDLIRRLVQGSDRFFEEVVLDVLVASGYGGSRADAAQRVGRAGDGGIDGVIREDRLGLDAIYVQAKKWSLDRTVGPREIREFIGALQDAEASKGVFITTSTFSAEARELARRRRIVLIDGTELAELMIDSDVGVTPLRSYEVKRLDEDYFFDEA